MIFAIFLAASAPQQADIVTPALRIAQANYAKAEIDKFAPQANVPLHEGDRFTVRLKFLPGDRRPPDDGGSSIWNYEDGILQLYFSSEPAYVVMGGDRIQLSAIFYSATKKVTGAYNGSNAFGVGTRVTKYLNKEYGIAVKSSPKAEPSPHGGQKHVDFMKKIGTPEKDLIGYYDTFIVSVSADGPEAKRLIQDAFAEIEGVISPIRGRITGCDGSFSSAEIRYPWEIKKYKCWASADITRVSIIDGGNGKVMKEWLTPTPPE